MSNQSDLAKSAAGFNGDPLSIDTANNRVGIGTSSPSSQLSLSEETSNTTTRSDQLRIEAQSSGTTGVGFGSNIYFVGERNGGTLQAMGRIGYAASTNTSTNLSSDFIVETASSGTPAERMRIDSAGRVTMPYQPSFYASITSDVAQDTANVHRLVPYNTVEHNEGNHFSTSTSLFTAPVSGVYQFNSTVRFNNISAGAYFLQRLWINPTISSGTVTTGTAPSGMYSISTLLSSYNTRMLAGTIKLSANDTVGITGYAQGDTDWAFDNNSHFSGYLIG